MMRMRPPQHQQGCSGAFGSSGFAVAALMASTGMSGTASSSRIRSMLLARVGPVNRSYRLNIDNQLKLARSLNRKISGLCAFEDAVGVARDIPTDLVGIGRVGSKAATGNKSI
jgi:hypothetical protein